MVSFYDIEKAAKRLGDAAGADSVILFGLKGENKINGWHRQAQLGGVFLYLNSIASNSYYCHEG